MDGAGTEKPPQERPGEVGAGGPIEERDDVNRQTDCEPCELGKFQERQRKVASMDEREQR